MRVAEVTVVKVSGGHLMILEGFLWPLGCDVDESCSLEGGLPGFVDFGRSSMMCRIVSGVMNSANVSGYESERLLEEEIRGSFGSMLTSSS